MNLRCIKTEELKSLIVSEWLTNAAHTQIMLLSKSGDLLLRQAGCSSGVSPTQPACGWGTEFPAHSLTEIYSRAGFCRNTPRHQPRPADSSRFQVFLRNGGLIWSWRLAEKTLLFWANPASQTTIRLIILRRKSISIIRSERICRTFLAQESSCSQRE